MTYQHALRHDTNRILTYSPALDGLRAVSVLAVMLYHAAVPWLPGGFLGVDAFFVLSGFLITSLLLVEWKRWGSIDLLTFWTHRARRLLPALVLVVVAACVAAWRLEPPEKLGTTRGDALATLFYVANWRFILKDQSYFEQYGDPSPFRHMWSLGIEEQYYLLFPLLLVGLLPLIARRPGRLAPLFVVAALASAALMAWLFDPTADASRVYYGTDTRAQELLVGATAAVLVHFPPAYLRGRRVGGLVWHVLGLAGLATLVGAFVLIEDSDPWLYRGGFLVVSVAVAGLLVAVTKSADSVAARLLAVRPLVGIGVISYGLYLWHWPVDIYVSPLRTGLEGTPLLAARLLVPLALATASYFLVERPIRRGALSRLAMVPRRAVLALSVPVATGLVLAATAAATPPAPEPWTLPPGPEAVSQAPTPTPSKPGKKDAGPLRVMMVGDSVPYGLIEHFPRTVDIGVTPIDGTKLGCGLFPELGYIDGKLSSEQPEGCAEHSANLSNVVADTLPQVGAVFVGIGEQFDRGVGDEVVGFGTDEYAAWLTAQLDARVEVFRSADVPVVLTNVPCHNVIDLGLAPQPPIINDESRITWLNGVIADYAADHPEVSLIDLHGHLCADGYQEVVDGIKLRTDGLHFGTEGAAYVWDWLVPQLREAARSRE